MRIKFFFFANTTDNQVSIQNLINKKSEGVFFNFLKPHWCQTTANYCVVKSRQKITKHLKILAIISSSK